MGCLRVAKIAGKRIKRELKGEEGEIRNKK
jgi:hypothetical protein